MNRRLFAVIMLCCAALFANANIVSDTTGRNGFALQTPDAGVSQMDSLIEALFSTNPAWEYNAQDYTADKINPLDTVRFSPEVYAERIAKISTNIPLTYNSNVQAFINLYTVKKRGKVSQMLTLSQQYFPMIEEELDRNGMPIELKYVAVIESALNTHAVSKAGATGLWQMMYGTGKLMGLKIDTYVDERRDPYLATKAGIAYLKYLYDIYDDWLLAIGAYNCGPGNMNKAIRRAGGGSDLTFWDLWDYLPKETRSYVPIFIAATYTFEYHKEHNIVPESFGYTYQLQDTVLITRKMTLEQLSAFVNMTVDEIKIYNPALKTNTIPGYPIPFPVRLPMDAIAMFYANQTELYASLDKPIEYNIATASAVQDSAANTETVVSEDPVRITYTVKKGDNLGYISDWFDCSVADLKSWNKLSSTKIVPGQKLKVEVPGNKQTYYAEINSMTMSEKQKLTDVQIVGTSKANSEPEFVFYTVKPGDTLWGISKKYPENSVEKIREMNDLSKSETLKVGDKIKLVK